MKSNFALTAFKISLLSWMTVLPFGVGLANLFLILSSFFLLIHLLKNPPSDWRNVLGFPAVILFMLLLLSILQSEDKWNALNEVKKRLPFIFSTCVIYFGFQLDKTIIRKALNVLIFSTSIAFVFSAVFNLLPYAEAKTLHRYFGDLLQPFEESNADLFGWYVPFMVRIQFGNLLSFITLATLVVSFLERKYTYFAVAIVFGLMVFILGVRGSMLGLIFAALFVIALVLKEKRTFEINKRIVFGLIILLIPIVIYASEKMSLRWKQTKFEWEVIQNGSYTNYDYQHFTLLTRMISWKNGADLWKENPFIGTGIGDYKREYAKTYENDDLKIPLYYHSQWLYFLGVFGILGLLIMLSFWLKWLFQFRGNKFQMLYGALLSAYLAVIWLFDAGMMSQIDMMSFGLFTTFILCYKEN